MAITRTPQIDDDGTGTTGTIWNNAWKTELYNQIDAALVGTAAYSEGAWTPDVSFLSGAVGITYSAREGYWARIGRLVILQGRFVFSSKGTSTGPLDLISLPYTAGAFAALYGGLTVTFHGGLTGITGPVTAYISPGTSRARFVHHPGGASLDVADTNCTGTASFTFYGFYFA